MALLIRESTIPIRGPRAYRGAYRVKYCKDGENRGHAHHMAIRLKAPLGFIDLRHAIVSMWGRIYASGAPAWLVEAAEAHATTVGSPLKRTVAAIKFPKDPKPITLIIDALQSKNLKLFIYSGSCPHAVPIPSSSVNAALERTGFLQLTAESALCRSMDFYPRRILNDVELPEFRSVKFDSFAFCPKERAFDEWLAGVARRLRWPLDVKRHPHSGRPSLDHLIRPVLQDVIASGRRKVCR